MMSPLFPPATPRRPAEAFTIELEDAANSSAAGGSLSSFVPARLRKAMLEREEQARKMSTASERKTAPVAKKAVSWVEF